MANPLASFECILFKILPSSVCHGLKPFQTGTPFCGSHLREIFGLQATYLGPKKIDSEHVMTFGPFLQVSPDKKFDIGTYILPRKQTLEAAVESSPDRDPVNPYLISFLQMLKTKQGAKHEILAVHDLLLNWTEENEEKSFSTETDKCVRERKSAFKNIYQDIAVVKGAAASILVPIKNTDETEDKTPLINQPFMLAFCGIHIMPGVYEYTKDYINQTAVSNVSLNEKGYLCVKTLEHLDILIQTGKLVNPAHHNQMLHHQRTKTSQDVNMLTVEYNTLLGKTAYPKPFQSYETIRFGNTSCPSK